MEDNGNKQSGITCTRQETIEEPWSGQPVARLNTLRYISLCHEWILRIWSAAISHHMSDLWDQMGMFYERLGRDVATASRYCDLLYTYIQDALIVFPGYSGTYYGFWAWSNVCVRHVYHILCHVRYCHSGTALYEYYLQILSCLMGHSVHRSFQQPVWT